MALPGLKYAKTANTGRVYIIQEKCIGCSLCARNCPTGAAVRTKFVAPGKKVGSFVIIPERCDPEACGTLCLQKCKFGAVKTRSAPT